MIGIFGIGGAELILLLTLFLILLGAHTFHLRSREEPGPTTPIALLVIGACTVGWLAVVYLLKWQTG
jgi:hypothetical protein